SQIARWDRVGRTVELLQCAHQMLRRAGYDCREAIRVEFPVAGDRERQQRAQQVQRHGEHHLDRPEQVFAPVSLALRVVAPGEAPAAEVGAQYWKEAGRGDDGRVAMRDMAELVRDDRLNL